MLTQPAFPRRQLILSKIKEDGKYVNFLGFQKPAPGSDPSNIKY